MISLRCHSCQVLGCWKGGRGLRGLCRSKNGGSFVTSVFPSKNHDSKRFCTFETCEKSKGTLCFFSFSSSSYQLSRHKSLHMNIYPFVSGVFPGWRNISEIRKSTNSSFLGGLTIHMLPTLGRKKTWSELIRFSRSPDISLVKNHSRRFHAWWIDELFKWFQFYTPWN